MDIGEFQGSCSLQEKENKANRVKEPSEVSRFMFTPRENNTLSNQIAHGICDNFEWMTYYVPPDPSSPAYVTEPLNDGNVSAVIYEAYTEDPTNVTLEHDKEIIDYIDNWNFTNKSDEKPFIFF